MKLFSREARKLPVNDDPICANEIQEAEIFYIKSIQKQFYKSETDSLKSTRTLSKHSSLHPLAPFMYEIN